MSFFQRLRSQGRLISMVGIIFVVAIAWLWRGSPSVSPTISFDPVEEDVGFSEGAVAALVPAQSIAVTPEGFDLSRVLRAREAYLEFAQYPPSSRPYDDGLREIVDWNNPIDYELRLTDPGVEPVIYGSLQLDRMFAGPGEEIVVTVRIRSESEASSLGIGRVDFELEGFVEAEDKATADSSGVGKRERVERLGFSPTEDPNVWQARFTPSEIAELAERPLNARLSVEIEFADTSKTLSTDFRYSAKEVVSIYGSLGEKIIDGSLQVTLDAEIHRPGPVKVRAVLFDPSGTRPLVTYSEYQHPTSTGRQELTMTFFGKAIVDMRSPGPYQIRSVHGILRDPEANPPEIFWAYRDTITTAAYAASDFSASEWAHPSKDAKLEMYERMVSQIPK